MLLALAVVVLLLLFWAPLRQDESNPVPIGDAEKIPLAQTQPADVASPESLPRTFRAGFRPIFIFISGSAIPLALIILIIQHEPSFIEFLLMCGFALVLGLPLSALGAFAVCRVFRVTFDSSGVRTYSPVGPGRFIGWDEMEVRGMLPLWTLPHLILKSRISGKWMWLPLFLHPREDLRGCVAGFVPTDHPVLKYL